MSDWTSYILMLFQSTLLSEPISFAPLYLVLKHRILHLKNWNSFKGQTIVCLNVSCRITTKWCLSDLNTSSNDYSVLLRFYCFVPSSVVSDQCQDWVQSLLPCWPDNIWRQILCCFWISSFYCYFNLPNQI